MLVNSNALLGSKIIDTGYPCGNICDMSINSTRSEGIKHSLWALTLQTAQNIEMISVLN